MDTEVFKIAGTSRFTIRRILEGHAYAANGNTHNPTPRYYYLLLLDGQPVDGSYRMGTLRTAAKQDNAIHLYSV